jgi:hypothetical protein
MSVKGLEGINANAEIGVTTVRGATFVVGSVTARGKRAFHIRRRRRRRRLRLSWGCYEQGNQGNRIKGYLQYMKVFIQ